MYVISIVKTVVLVLVVVVGVCLVRQGQSYPVEGISFDFNCGSVQEALHRLCVTYQPHFSTNNTRKRSGRSTDHLAPPSFGLKYDSNTEPIKQIHMPEGHLRAEDALQLVRNTRELMTVNIQDECCSGNRNCDRTEIIEYCDMVRE
ncbi:hypothetical protein Pmani_007387 [Petrolisthes manimaculis]|uniref:Insulin-like androgenic gland hormone n=1 Tax=Petrolisthes manimaculis TaxID=1843537 RepID=A0AAE1Q8D5_9EUCA|nr:hypothetical protein Pmani_007387 [Petrolisthes manimaculis]